VVNRVLPDGCMDIIWDAGDSSRSPAPMVVGAMRSAIVVRVAGHVDVVGIRFRPAAAARLLGVPATALTDATADLGAFWKGTHELQDADIDSRIRSIEELLVSRAAREQAPDPLIEALVHRIESTHGRVSISELESLSSVSPRTLTRRFAAAVGLTPKLACRVARMQAAAAMMARDPAASLSRVALTAGYYDQAHFTRDFGELASITPAGYARECADGFLQDNTARIA